MAFPSVRASLTGAAWHGSRAVYGSDRIGGSATGCLKEEKQCYTFNQSLTIERNP